MAILQTTLDARVTSLEGDIQSLVDYLELNNLEALSITEVQALFDAATIDFDPSLIDYGEEHGRLLPVGIHHPHLQFLPMRFSDRDNDELYFVYRRQRRLIKSSTVQIDGTNDTSSGWSTTAVGGGSENNNGL